MSDASGSAGQPRSESRSTLGAGNCTVPATTPRAAPGRRGRLAQAGDRDCPSHGHGHGRGHPPPAAVRPWPWPGQATVAQAVIFGHGIAFSECRGKAAAAGRLTRDHPLGRPLGRQFFRHTGKRRETASKRKEGIQA